MIENIIIYVLKGGELNSMTWKQESELIRLAKEEIKQEEVYETTRWRSLINEHKRYIIYGKGIGDGEDIEEFKVSNKVILFVKKKERLIRDDSRDLTRYMAYIKEHINNVHNNSS